MRIFSGTFLVFAIVLSGTQAQPPKLAQQFRANFSITAQYYVDPSYVGSVTGAVWMDYVHMGARLEIGGTGFAPMVYHTNFVLSPNDDAQAAALFEFEGDLCAQTQSQPLTWWRGCYKLIIPESSLFMGNETIDGILCSVWQWQNHSHVLGKGLFTLWVAYDTSALLKLDVDHWNHNVSRMSIEFEDVIVGPFDRHEYAAPNYTTCWAPTLDWNGCGIYPPEVPFLSIVMPAFDRMLSVPPVLAAPTQQPMPFVRRPNVGATPVPCAPQFTANYSLVIWDGFTNTVGYLGDFIALDWTNGGLLLKFGGLEAFPIRFETSFIFHPNATGQDNSCLSGFVYGGDLCFSCGQASVQDAHDLILLYANILWEISNFVGNETLDGHLCGRWNFNINDFGTIETNFYIAWDTSAFMGLDIYIGGSLNATLRLTNVKVGPVNPKLYNKPKTDCPNPPSVYMEQYCDLIIGKPKTNLQTLFGPLGKVMDMVLATNPTYAAKNKLGSF